jgi:hypothetical protein
VSVRRQFGSELNIASISFCGDDQPVGMCGCDLFCFFPAEIVSVSVGMIVVFVVIIAYLYLFI